MWMRSCPKCKRELRKVTLWEVLVCACGWKWVGNEESDMSKTYDIPKLKIRSLTSAEEEYIEKAIRTLYLTSTIGSSDRWAADVMIESNFAQRFLLREK
jgi:hypothetical protein